MVLLHHFTSHISTVQFFTPHRRSISPLRRRFLHPLNSVSSTVLPSPIENAEYHRELEAAINAVQKACHLCVDVKKTLFSSGDNRMLNKDDKTPVTVADFGVQALVSLELSKLFPSIPLVAEEDSAAIQSSGSLSELVLEAVSSYASSEGKEFTKVDIFNAIDRGGQNAVSFGTQPATYWVLDPLDGTRGFQKQEESLYVVGLALIVKGKTVLGVMGCPTWQEDSTTVRAPELQDNWSNVNKYGIVMISHIGLGTWTKKLSYSVDLTNLVSDSWVRCCVDSSRSVYDATFCIPNSHKWESLPLSSTSLEPNGEAVTLKEDEIVLLKTCCGSLCKYMMVASGKASVFILETKKAQKAWDHAVGMICVNEAGGKVSDWKGNEIDLAADLSERRMLFPSGGILATNRSLHDMILDMISSSSSFN